MSWFSKNKKEGDIGKLPEIPKTGNLMSDRKNNMQMEKESNYFPEFPQVRNTENMPYREKYDSDDFNLNNLPDNQKKFNLVRDLNEKKRI